MCPLCLKIKGIQSASPGCMWVFIRNTVKILKIGTPEIITIIVL